MSALRLIDTVSQLSVEASLDPAGKHAQAFEAIARMSAQDMAVPTLATATSEARIWAAAKARAIREAPEVDCIGMLIGVEAEGLHLFPEVDCIGKLLFKALAGHDVTTPCGRD